MNETQTQQTPQWYPWCAEAFARAEAEHKPILLFVGSRCEDAHSCKTDSTVSRIAQRYFIPIHLDASELPGAAAVYAQASELLNGYMEPPFAVVADHLGRPFFALRDASPVALSGTLSRIALHWNSDSGKYEQTSRLLQEKLEHLSGAVQSCSPHAQLWENHFKALQSRFDRENGGFGRGKKYPMPQELLFLLAYHRHTGDAKALAMACFTLIQLALGGIRDHLGGGFFHFTTDSRWEIPSTRKYLADQAWLLEAYARAYAQTGKDFFKDVARETADYVLRELRSEAGGFYAAQWAEASYYTLTDHRVRAQLGDNDGSIFCREYCIGETPTVPHLYNGKQPTRDSDVLRNCRTNLYRARLTKGGLQRDERIFTGANGVMIASLATAGRILGVERYLTAASDGEAYLREHLRSKGDLQHYSRRGKSSGQGTLGDYAGYALALDSLYHCGCGGEYLRSAVKVMTRADALFGDREQQGFFLTRDSRNLPVRPKQFWEELGPSDQSVALKVLVDLAGELPYPGLVRRAREQMDYAAGTARSFDCGYALTALMRA